MSHSIATRLRAAVVGGIVAAAAPAALAQGTYPDHSIRMVLPFVAGGGTDAVGRIIAKGLSERLKQPVVVDNRAGGVNGE